MGRFYTDYPVHSSCYYLFGLRAAGLALFAALGFASFLVLFDWVLFLFCLIELNTSHIVLYQEPDLCFQKQGFPM